MAVLRVDPDLSREPRPSPGEVARDIANLPSHRLFAALPPATRRKTMDFLDWLIRSTPAETRGQSLVEELCQRMLALGLPIDRYGSSTTVLTADHDAIGRVWLKGRGVEENVYVRPEGDDPNYLRSPLYEATRTRAWVELWLAETPDDRFGIVPELKAAHYTHYLCIPLAMPPGAEGWVTAATQSPGGFSREHLVILALVVPVLGMLINARVARLTLDRLLRTYVGDEPHRAILQGNVKRGQVATIRSAILFADMRDSTGHTAEISAVQAVALFNDFFDCLVPPIETRGGEVLKYIGDGLLAIFREGPDGAKGAAVRALDAARNALTNLRALNETRPGARPVEMGIALHYGEAAYGNVGSGLRLDFTVIGRDIGLASRIGGLNARLGEALLMSAAFVDKLQGDASPIGAFMVRGFSEPVAVFRPH